MDKKYCTNCGTENVSNASFCISCGSSFETKPVEENVVEETPIVNETPVVNTEVQTPSVTPEPPKKKKKKGGLIALIVILLIAGLIVGGIYLFKKLTFFEDPFINLDGAVVPVTKSVSEQLGEDLASGKLTKDQYIIQMAYSLNDPDMVNPDYKSLTNTTDMNYLLEKANENANELSDETILYLYNMISLKDMKWVVPEKDSYDDTSANITYVKKTNGRSLNQLDHVKLSKNGHFLVYYSTDGKNAISNSKAKRVANYLEDVVSYYKDEYGYDFQYDITYNTRILSTELFEDMSGLTTAALLAQNDIDISYLNKAMPIYIIDTDYENTNLLGWNCADINLYGQLAVRMMNLAEDDVKYDSAISTYAFPYTVISTSVFDQFDNAKIVMGHELFHHYQHYVCGDGTYAMCKSGLFTIETTADLGGLKASGIKKNVELLNDHAIWYMSSSDKSINKVYYPALGDASLGYGAFIFAYNYADIVPNGLKTLSLSGKSYQPLEFLEENSYGAFGKVMERMGEKNLTRDYDNKALMPTSNGEPVYPANHYEFKAPTDDKAVWLAREVEPAAINYYYFDTNAFSENTYVTFKPFNIASHKFDNATILFFVKENGSYKKVYSTNKKIIFNIGDFSYYDQVAVAVVSTSAKYSESCEISVKDPLDASKYITDYDKEFLITAKGLGLKTKDQKKKGLFNNDKIATSKIVCTQVEDVEYIKSTYQVLVEFGHNDDIKDMYVKGTVEMEEDNAAFKIAKGITTGAVFLLKQKYKEQFGKITLRTYDEGNKYIILGRVKKDVDTAARNSFGTNDLTREGIFKAIEDKGFTCEYR